MGALGETANSSRRGDAEFPELILDPPAITLERRTILVKRSLDGGYLCLGLGAGAEFLRAVDEDDAFFGVSDDPDDPDEQDSIGDASPLARSDDASLRRLGMALALTKAGFDPNEPRDEGGPWTGSGASAAGGAAASTATASATDIFTPSALVPALRQLATRVLPAGVDAPVAALGMVFIPTNHSLISEGSVPKAPSISYHFDQGTGVLTLTRELDDGSTQILFSHQHVAGGLFRDDSGNIVGRELDGTVVIDPDAIPGYSARSTARSPTRSRAQARSVAAVDRDEPKLCPDPGPDTGGWPKRSEQSLAYQEQISGLPRGFAIELNGVSFDGCRESDGTMLEAKGSGFEWAMTTDTHWRDRYHGVTDNVEQAHRQHRAAPNRHIEWHFAEKPVADYFRERFAAEGLTNITVFYTPAIVRKILL